MNLAPYLHENPRLQHVCQHFPSVFAHYEVRLASGGIAHVIHAPNKLCAHALALLPVPEPCVIIVATRRTPEGLIRQRVDEGLRFAQYHERNRT